MKHLSIPAFLFYSVFTSHLTNGQDKEGANAESYDAATFTAELKKNRNFVMFYAPWCGHCKNLAPVWDELAKFYSRAEDNPVVVAKVDCTVHTALCDAHDVVGFPTLKFFDVGGENHQRYTGKRDLESFKTFVQKKILGIRELPEEADFGDLKDEKPSEAGPVILTRENFAEHVKEGFTFVKFFAPWCGHCKKLAPTWDELAETFAYNDKVSIAKIDCTRNREVCQLYEVKGYPTLLWFKDGEKIEKYQGARTHTSLKNYVSDKLLEEAQVQYGSDEERVPGRGSEGIIKTLTDETFSFHISSGLVFVKFFTAWCSHCKKLAPVYEEVAREFAGRDISFAELDCTLYKTICEDNNVLGYPTLKLFRDGTFVEDYKGVRTFEGIRKFVNKWLEAHNEL